MAEDLFEHASREATEAEAPLDPAQDTDRQYRYAGYPAGYNRYQQEPGPFDPVFDNYDADDYYFDCYGVYAMRYLLGGAEAHQAAVSAVFNYRCRIALAKGRQFGDESDPEDSPELVPAAAPAAPGHLRLQGPALDFQHPRRRPGRRQSRRRIPPPKSRPGRPLPRPVPP